MGYPDGWTILNEELWHLPPSEAHAFWQALCRARSVRPVSFRQQLGLVGHVRLTEDGLGRLCQPAVVLAVLEALVQERQLSRRQCTRIEDTILDQRGHDVPVATQTRLSFDVILPLWGHRGPR